jgi:glycosyltransferase involved in cell wall biosynthesis
MKWARSLADSGLEISIFGLSTPDRSNYLNYPSIQLHTLGLHNSLIRAELGNPSKLRYLRALPKVKKLIRESRPDIVHAHFATSYGFLGALSSFEAYIVSVWGADIFDFPRKSFIHKALVEYNLKKAKRILSTSHMMAKEVSKYTDKEVEVTPFGIDVNVFRPRRVQGLFREDDIVIGTVKALEKKYGVEYLLRAFKTLRDKYPQLPLKLLIVGGGSQDQQLRDLAKELEVERDTVFVGRVSYDQVSDYHNMLSIFVSLSVLDSESFGVAIIEASACEKPVVVSNVGGQPEVVENGVTGFVVPAGNAGQAAEAIEKLILNEALRIRMGRAGRERVKTLYNWEDCVRQMIGIYDHMVK